MAAQFNQGGANNGGNNTNGANFSGGLLNALLNNNAKGSGKGNSTWTPQTVKLHIRQIADCRRNRLACALQDDTCAEVMGVALPYLGAARLTEHEGCIALVTPVSLSYSDSMAFAHAWHEKISFAGLTLQQLQEVFSAVESVIGSFGIRHQQKLPALCREKVTAQHLQQQQQQQQNAMIQVNHGMANTASFGVSMPPQQSGAQQQPPVNAPSTQLDLSNPQLREALIQLLLQNNTGGNGGNNDAPMEPAGQGPSTSQQHPPSASHAPSATAPQGPVPQGSAQGPAVRPPPPRQPQFDAATMPPPSNLPPSSNLAAPPVFGGSAQAPSASSTAAASGLHRSRSATQVDIATPVSSARGRASSVDPTAAPPASGNPAEKKQPRLVVS